MAASSSSNGDAGGARRGISSIVEDHGVYNSVCGYCKSGLGASHGMTTHRLHVDDYQELLDRGWRRSGTFLYKPERRTCCPPYTIRLSVDAFVPSKEQVRVRRRMNRYLEGESREEVDGSKETPTAMDTAKEVDEVSVTLVESMKAALTDWILDTRVGSDFQIPEFGVRKMSEKVKNQLKNKDAASPPAETIYTSNVSFLVASALKRRCSRLSNEESAAAIDVLPADLASQLASKLSDSDRLPDGVVVKACKGHVNFHLPSGPSGKAACTTTCKANDTNPNGAINGVKPAPARKRKRILEIRTQRSAFDTESFELYKKYQVVVHNDSAEHVQESSYKRFLVDSPLVPAQNGSTSYGSFHQQYRIDGHLVAVGVVDILPRCLSSKYLFWDPDYAFLSLGKFSALQEIDWVRSAADPSLRYYYLGYYIHSCPKMRYKAAYAPSELLCPSTLNWIPFDIARPLVETGASVCLSGTNKGVDAADESPAATTEPIRDVPILLYGTGRCVLLKDLELSAPKRIIDKLKRQLLDYFRLVGDDLASRMAYGYSIRPKFS